MKLTNLTAIAIISFLLLVNVGWEPGCGVTAQEPVFELPVQLVGFPVIILAVRFSNFVKKLSYSLNPQTYKKRTRRFASVTGDVESEEEISRRAINVSIAAKRIQKELGNEACVLEEPCKLHANRPSQFGEQPDWTDILKNYKVQANDMKQWYLLSVFLGDVIRDPLLCHQLAKRLDCGSRITRDLLVRD